LAWLFEVTKRECWATAFGESLLEMPAADRDVAFIPADADLLTGTNWAAAFINSQHHRRFSATVADGFDFRQHVGPCQQVLAALEQIPLKVGSQTIAQHWHIQTVRHLAKVVDLALGQKLRFVDEDAGNDLGSDMAVDEAEQGVVGPEGGGGR